MREIIDSTYRIPKLPQVDLVPAVERYFDFVQRTVDANRGLSVRWARKATTLSDTVRERAESAGDAVRERAESVGGLVRGKADTIGQTARDQAAKASGHRKPASSSARGQGRLISAPASVTRA